MNTTTTTTVPRSNSRRSVPMKRLISLLAAVLLMTGLMAVPAAPAEAAKDQPCTQGDAQALFETLVVANQILLREGADHPWADTLIHCQFRFFWEGGDPLLGQPVKFSEDDIFLGGLVYFLPYQDLGLTRREAVAILEQVEVRTWLAEVTDGSVGSPVEQPLMETVVKSTATADLGLLVHKQWGYIAQLPAGTYVSTTEATDPFSDAEYLWRVEVVITPSASDA
jgi:hypothetical protein